MNISLHFNLPAISSLSTLSPIVLLVCCLMLTPASLAKQTNQSNDMIQINKLRVIAENYQKSKQFQESIVIYQSLIKVQPENLTLHLDLALSYYYNQNFQQAKDQIDYVKSHPSFSNAPELVIKNIEKLYISINQKLSSINFKDPTFPSNTKTWDTSFTLTGSSKTHNTLITETQKIETDNSLDISAQLFVNYKIIKPVENWRLDQNINIYQLNKTFESNKSSSFSNLNYNIGYKKVINGNRIFSSEFSASYSSSQLTEEPSLSIKYSQSVEEPSLGLKFGYQLKKHQFLFTTKKHWQNIQLTHSILNETQNYDTITPELTNNYWTLSTQYKSAKKWLLQSKVNSVSLNWKSKPTIVTGESGYFKFEQQLGATVKINKKLTWLTQVHFRFLEYSELIKRNDSETLFKRTDSETRWYQTINYDINPNWLTSVSQQYKYRHSTADDKTIDQWQYQLTLKWVN
ncbi:MAG: hypothetical protein HRU38_15920 [Saccharospirillaceae bacterium]|nr:hypothetical protein [Pseudomonadales bacterium]NRB80129.1 hypothetical protein [Saccharospirillaceae bacterium]